MTNKPKVNLAFVETLPESPVKGTVYMSPDSAEGFLKVGIGDNETETIFDSSVYVKKSDSVWVAGEGANSAVLKDSSSHAIGTGAVAHGSNATAAGDYSHAEGLRTIASGDHSHAEGCVTVASGSISHAEGYQTRSSGQCSHAEGHGNIKSLSFTISGDANATTYTTNTTHGLKKYDVIEYNGVIAMVTAYISNRSFSVDHTLSNEQLTNASGLKKINGTSYGASSHAEGFQTGSLGQWSHAEGSDTIAFGNYSHSEGYKTTVSGNYSHAEGYNTTVSGTGSHVEGTSTKASGGYAHAEGSGADASGYYSHAEGNYTKAYGSASHAEGSLTIASGDYSHAEGQNTSASGQYSHAEGNITSAIGQYSHAEGYFTKAFGQYSHAEGFNTDASGGNSHTEGYQTKTSGTHSHAEGYSTTASGISSHAEGYSTNASSDYSHTEGSSTTASGISSHAEGYNTTASGASSHAEGSSTTASGISSHAEGYNTEATNDYEHAQGYMNFSHNNTIFSIGNGYYDKDDQEIHSNALEIDKNGKAYLYGVASFDGKTISDKKTLQSFLNINRISNLEYNYIFDISTGVPTELLSSHLIIDRIPEDILPDIEDLYGSLSDYIASIVTDTDNGALYPGGSTAYQGGPAPSNRWEYSGETMSIDGNDYYIWYCICDGGGDDGMYGLMPVNMTLEICIDNSMHSDILNRWTPFEYIMFGDNISSYTNLSVRYTLIYVKEYEYNIRTIGDFDLLDATLYLDTFGYDAFGRKSYYLYGNNAVNIGEYVDYYCEHNLNDGNNTVCTYQEDITFDGETYHMWYCENGGGGYEFYGLMPLSVTAEEVASNSKYAYPLNMYCPFTYQLNYDDREVYSDDPAYLKTKRCLLTVVPGE